MSETLLEELMQLFALLTDVKHTEHSMGRSKVEDFLTRQFSRECVHKFLGRYEFYLRETHEGTLFEDREATERKTQENMRKMCRIASQINAEVDLAAKVMLLSTFLNYIAKPQITDEEELFVDRLADWLRIPPCDYWNLKAFSLKSPRYVADKKCLLVINGRPERPHPDVKHIYISKFGVEVWVLHIAATNTFVFRYQGERNLYLSGHKVEVNRVYALESGTVLGTSHVSPVYFGHVAEKFITRHETGRIIYRATDIEFKFSDTNIGIHKFSFLGKSGQLVGVMGGSGTGKSTLLNVLNGSYKLSSGTITINGYDLVRDRKALKGVIGYVPQDDVLIEELTVYQNLMFNARLVFSGKSPGQRAELVEKALVDFDLVEARDMRVGTPLNKILSGGQRKRLNIALELMREPSILFVDEPTSGLSSIDSEKVMMLLKRQVLKGKLVIINIHQPNSDIYKLLDKLLIIDQGGRIVYNGNPMRAIVYFKTKAHYVNPEERECFTCGNVKTEQPLRIIEARKIDPSGRVVRQRKTSPEEWYRQYCEEFEGSFDWKNKTAVKEKLPENLYSAPGRWSQFKTYMLRDALTKLRNTQYVLINIFEVPLLAFVLAWATRHIEEGAAAYDFFSNSNLPTYLFMSVVVAIFVGLNVSAEEIIGDRKLLKREAFLNLSRSSYLNSKIFNLFILAAFQSFMLAFIGNWVLEIKGMLLSFWGILFSTFAWAIMFGLNISSGLKTQVSIYISIPLVLVPQLLFSGTMVDFAKLSPDLRSREFTPLIGDITASRWSYEALAVAQFKNNAYEEYYFDLEVRRSEASYASAVWIPELLKINDECQRLLADGQTEALKTKSDFLFLEMSKLQDTRLKKIPVLVRSFFQHDVYEAETHDRVQANLNALRQANLSAFSICNTMLDNVSEELMEHFGGERGLLAFKRLHYNDALAQLVLNKRDLRAVSVYPDRLVRRKQPIYNIPDAHWGAAHFYAPYKRFAGLTIPTPLFNMLVLWFFTGLLYATLYFDLLHRLLARFERARKLRRSRRLQKMRDALQ